VLCYNITLAARLRLLMQEKGIADRVNVYHFHDWCGELLRQYHVEKPQVQGEAYFDALPKTVLEHVEKGQIPRGQYGAIMIDEGHDFKAKWLRLISGMVDPETDSLLLLYDDAQSIYSAERQLNFSLSSVGIKAKGRTTVLKMNYRNTQEVFQFADRFAKRYLQATDADKALDDDQIPVVAAQSVGRSGITPKLRQFASFAEEVRKITAWLQQWHQQKQLAWSEMCVLYRHAAKGRALQQALAAAQIPHQWLADSAHKKQFNPQDDSVKLMTLHSSKGLEFPLVIIAGLGFTPQANDDKRTEAKLLYVAMTRATDKLLLTYHQETEFTEHLCDQQEDATSSAIG